MNARLNRNSVLAVVLGSLALGASVCPASAAQLPRGYILSRTSDTLVYGQPREIAAIRSRLTAICTDGRHLPGLGPALADEIVQVEGYAIAEGSCGNPELGAILRKVSGIWMRAKGPTGAHCSMGAGAVPNYGRFGLYGTLIKKCAFPVAIANRIIGVRAGPTSEVKSIRVP
jgi:hypothetical protein